VVSGSRVMGVTFVELSTPSSRLVAALTGTGGDPGRAYVIHVYRQPDVADYGYRCDYEFVILEMIEACVLCGLLAVQFSDSSCGTRKNIT
jgi:hypothetical protein